VAMKKNTLSNVVDQFYIKIIFHFFSGFQSFVKLYSEANARPYLAGFFNFRGRIFEKNMEKYF
jgi:hypothetical protein